jgi:hypothetical protein
MLRWADEMEVQFYLAVRVNILNMASLRDWKE